MHLRKAQTVRILIADDHPIFRDGLRRLLEAEEDLKVLGEAADGAEAVKLARQLKPDILLLDLAMPKHPGLEALRDLSVAPGASPVRVILLTAQGLQPGMLGHGQIQQQDVRLQLPRQFHRLGPVGSLAQNLEVLLGFQQAPQAVPEDGVVVGNQDTNGLRFPKMHGTLPHCAARQSPGAYPFRDLILP